MFNVDHRAVNRRRALPIDDPNENLQPDPPAVFRADALAVAVRRRPAGQTVGGVAHQALVVGRVPQMADRRQRQGLLDGQTVQLGPGFVDVEKPVRTMDDDALQGPVHHFLEDVAADRRSSVKLRECFDPGLSVFRKDTRLDDGVFSCFVDHSIESQTRNWTKKLQLTTQGIPNLENIAKFYLLHFPVN